MNDSNAMQAAERNKQLCLSKIAGKILSDPQ